MIQSRAATVSNGEVEYLPTRPTPSKKSLTHEIPNERAIHIVAKHDIYSHILNSTSIYRSIIFEEMTKQKMETILNILVTHVVFKVYISPFERWVEFPALHCRRRKNIACICNNNKHKTWKNLRFSPTTNQNGIAQ